jgi:hypothetical protein
MDTMSTTCHTSDFSIKIFNILFESKQNLVALGIPEVIASLIYEKFGKNAFLIARWYRDNSARPEGEAGIYPANWWKLANTTFSSNVDLRGLVDLWEAAGISEEEYQKTREAVGLERDDVEDDNLQSFFDSKTVQKTIKEEIARELFKSVFFSYTTIIQDIVSGKLTDLKPYKDLSFQDAKDKYDKKNLFKDPGKVIKTYENGWRWIDAGKKCQFVGGLMKNCGSVGVMSLDPDSTMLSLFDSKNKPHVVVTYSPNQKRISGDEGVAGSAVKSQYHDYILDLAKTLGAKQDFENSKSNELKLKGKLGDQLQKMEIIKKGTYNNIYKVTMIDGTSWFTDSYNFYPENEVLQLLQTDPSLKGKLDNALTKAFNVYSDSGVRKIHMFDFAQGKR